MRRPPAISVDARTRTARSTRATLTSRVGASVFQDEALVRSRASALDDRGLHHLIHPPTDAHRWHRHDRFVTYQKRLAHCLARTTN
jgi:uncharacterized membrane-anchored protein